MPARSISWWLTTSASAGASFCVEMKNFEVSALRSRHLRRCLWRWAVEKSSEDSNLRRCGHARQGRLPSERRHHPCQPEERGVLGQAREPARLAVPAGRHQARRDPAAGDVPRARGGDRAGSAATCASSAARASGCATRCRSAGRVAQREAQRRRLPRAEADLVPAAHGGARLRRQAARERPSGVRRLALARLLGAARGGDRLQARGVPPGADRAAPLPRWPTVAGARRDRSR